MAFLAWFSRMVENVPPLTGWIPMRTPRAAIGWWFVPFANFWIPFTIAREALRRLEPGGRSWAARLVPIWWVLYLAGDTISRVSGQLAGRMETIDEIRAVLVVSLAATVMLTVAGCCLVILVRSIDEIGRRRAAALGIGSTGAPEWPSVAYAIADAQRAAEATEVVPAEPLSNVVAATSAAAGEGPLLPPPPA